MKLLTPQFLRHVQLTKADIQEAAPQIRNWLRTFEVYKDLSLEQLEKYIIIELNYKQRKSVLDRLLGRYTKLKKNEYEKQLKKEIGGNFKTGNIEPVNEFIERIIQATLNEN